MLDVHDLLNSFIDKRSPAPAKFLFRMWQDQQKAITYHELRDAITSGALSIDYFSQWQQDYTKFLTESYAPLVEQAVQQAKADMTASYGGQLEMPVHDMIDDYINQHGGTLIREVSENQYEAINTLVRQSTLTDTLTVDELARCIRPCIGLTERQAASLKSYYDQLREDGYSKKQALKKQQVRAAKMHRQRAALIAETESAFAYNNGMDMLVDHNIQTGLVSPDVEDEWATAKDERVCPICGTLDGVRIHHGDSFPNGYTCPPGHPACRCTKKYHYKAPERPESQLPVEPPPDSDEWFEDGCVSPKVYDQVSDELLDNDFEISNKDIREMVDAVYEYTTSDYTDILASEAGYSGRFAQYGMTMTPDAKTTAAKNAKRINEYLSMAPKHEGTVWRALGFDVGGEFDHGGWESFKASYQPGNIVSTDTMSSWTKRKSVLNQIFSNRAGADETAEYSVEVTMTMKNGRTGVDISRLSELQSQDEVLFPKGKLKVLSYNEKWVDDEFLRVEVEVSEVPPDWML